MLTRRQFVRRAGAALALPSIAEAYPHGRSAIGRVGAASAAVFGIKAQGSKFVSTLDGSQINLIGSAMIGMEEPQGEGANWAGVAAVTSAQYTSAISQWYDTLSTAAKPYGLINCVRFPLNSASWLGLTGRDAFGDASGNYVSAGMDGSGNNLFTGLISGSTATYRDYVKQAVANALGANLYVLLDLHWDTPTLVSTGQYVLPAGQTMMPSRDAAVAFWTSIAQTFGYPNGTNGSPAIMFELFNEPFGSGMGYGSDSNYFGELYYDAQVAGSASVVNWPSASNPNGVNGGYAMLDNFGDNSAQNILGGGAACYTVGFPALISAIRGTGATNLLFAGPGNYAAEFRDNGLGVGNLWLDMALSDSLNNLGCSFHAYNSSVTASYFDAVQTAGFPVLCTEMGTLQGEDTYVNALAKGRGYCWWTWANFEGTSNMYNMGGQSMTGTNPYTGNGANAPTGSN